MGRRVWEMNHDWRHWPPRDKKTDIYLPRQVAIDFRSHLGTWHHLAFLQEMGLVRLVELADGETVKIGETRILPFRLAQDYVYGFLFEGEGKRILVVADELFGWQPRSDLKELDLAVLPMGIFEHHPLTGRRLVPEDHPVLSAEATFEQTLQVIRTLGSTKTVLTHIEEPDGLSFDDLMLLGERLCSQGITVEFAYDTMILTP
jgi:phosphoribosyl 1,2-cyclic phosphate phosphodiesterase